MTDSRETPTAFADDAEALEQARELVMRLDLIRQLAEHPAMNREQIERHRAECNLIVSTIGAHLLTAVYA